MNTAKVGRCKKTGFQICRKGFQICRTRRNGLIISGVYNSEMRYVLNNPFNPSPILPNPFHALYTKH